MSEMVKSTSNRSNRHEVSVGEQAELSIPSYFRCPISLELMSDPVTLSTGHTYDRSSIERWFRTGKNSCPQTRQEVSTKDLLPNLTLKNCIKNWQLSTNRSVVVPNNESQFPLSPRRLNEKGVRLLLDNIILGNHMLQDLKTLRIMARSSHRNRILLSDGGALTILKLILWPGDSSGNGRSNSSSFHYLCAEERQQSEPSLLQREEALGALVDLSMTEEIRQKLLPDIGLSNLPAVSWFLHNGSSEAKIHASQLVECLIEDDDCLQQLGAVDGLIQGLVALLQKHQVLPKALKSSLRSLYAICLPAKNRSLAVEAGAVAGVIEVLPGATREIAEGALAFLDLMSRCSEGRSALHEHALCIPILVKLTAAYSNSATENTIKVLHSMLINKVVDPLVYGEAIKSGLVSKLLMINQIQGTDFETQKKGREVLKALLLHCNTSDHCVRTIKYSR